MNWCDIYVEVSMVKTMANVFGVVFLLVGILGFVPGITPNGHLLGIFHVNTAHNLVHIASGIAALIAAGMGYRAARNYFRIFGAIYALVAILGFATGGTDPLLGLIANNPADNWLHAAIALVSLALGFAPQHVGQIDRRAPSAPV
jgi:hypothetical protein